MNYAELSIQEHKEWIKALEIEADGIEEENSRLSQARAALANRLTYED